MIPDYQTIMLPLMNLIADRKNHTNSEVIKALGQHFHLTLEELEMLLPSKRNTIMNNRVHWAKAHLKMAGLIETIDKGVFVITDRGKKVLDMHPPLLNVKFLMNEIPEYKAKVNGFRYKKKEDVVSTIAEDEDIGTPDERIESGYLKIRKALEEELISKLKTVNPYYFEKIVVELLVKMGYGGSIQDAGQAIGKSGDEGIDGIIKEDKLGLDVIYIQAKRWEGSVGRPELHRFVGALAGQGAKKGVFITTSSFTKDAVDYSPKNETKIVLIDGSKLAQLMIDYNLGVSIQNVYEIKKLDNDYFDEA